MSNVIQIQVQLSGLRPMMFDRYAGDNNTQLPVQDKMYLAGEKQLVVPALNVYSLLVSENTSSVTKTFFGVKTWRKVAMGIKAYTDISPFEIPLLDGQGEPIFFEGWNDQIWVHKTVARLNKGIPNPKERPVLELPWRLEFTMTYQENNYCTLDNLRQAFDWGGTMGLGTFRPFFGRYELTRWDY